MVHIILIKMFLTHALQLTAAHIRYSLVDQDVARTQLSISLESSYYHCYCNVQRDENILNLWHFSDKFVEFALKNRKRQRLQSIQTRWESNNVAISSYLRKIIVSVTFSSHCFPFCLSVFFSFQIRFTLFSTPVQKGHTKSRWQRTIQSQEKLFLNKIFYFDIIRWLRRKMWGIGS